jgi:hypothetical protein
MVSIYFILDCCRWAYLKSLFVREVVSFVDAEFETQVFLVGEPVEEMLN